MIPETDNTMDRPNVIMLAGPNGAGKSTIAPSILKGKLEVSEFVNADEIARGLSAFNPDGVAFEAGKVMLKQLDRLACQRVNFAFETTLSARSFAPWAKRLMETGYCFHLVFLWLPSAEIAVRRVEDRVRMGGHDIPEEVIRRRYSSGIRNFFNLYQPLTTRWRIYDNSMRIGRRPIAMGKGCRTMKVFDPTTWARIQNDDVKTQG